MARTARARLALAAAAVAALALAAGAFGDTFVLKDPPGKNIPVDVKSVTARHGPGGTLVYTITTYKPWKEAVLGSHGTICVRVWLESHRDQALAGLGNDASFCAVQDGGKLVGEGRMAPIWSEVKEQVALKRSKDRRSLTMTFSTNFLGSESAYLWQVGIVPAASTTWSETVPLDRKKLPLHRL